MKYKKSPLTPQPCMIERYNIICNIRVLNFSKRTERIINWILSNTHLTDILLHPRSIEQT